MDGISVSTETAGEASPAPDRMASRKPPCPREADASDVGPWPGTGFQDVRPPCRAAITTDTTTMKGNAAFTALKAPGSGDRTKENHRFSQMLGKRAGRKLD